MKIFWILIFSLLVASKSQCQSDSVEIFRLNDHYIEIKSLRIVLRETKPIDTPYIGIATRSFIPKPPRIQNGVVLIKDRQGKLLSLCIFQDSLIVQEDHYGNGKMIWQEFYGRKSWPGFQKYYWSNGNLQTLILFQNKEQLIYEYDEDGNLIMQENE